MPFPNAPTPLSYGAPNVTFEGLDQIGEKYFKGAEERRKYDLARAFPDGIPKGPDGQPDFKAMADVLAKGGDTSQAIPLNREALDRQQLAQLQGGGITTPQGGPVAPRGGPPAASSEPRMVGVPPRPVSAPTASPAAGAMPQPQLSSAGTDNAGAQTFRAMATELAGGRDVSTIIKNASTALKIDPDAPLTPEQEAQIKPILAKSIAAAQQQAPQGGPSAPAAPPQGSPSALLPPGNDPRQEIAKLRAAGENLLRTAGPHGQKLAQQYFDRADRVESDAFGEIRRAQSNTDRAFEEQKRQHDLLAGKPIPLTAGAQLVNPQTGDAIAKNNSGTFSEDALKAMITQYRAGDKSVLTNVGRGAQSAENLARFREMLAQQLKDEGLTGKDQAAAMANFGAQSAAAKTAAVREANVETSINEALATFPLAIEASKAVSRTDFVPYNKLVQMVKAGTSNVAQGKFLTSLQGAIIAYSQAMSRTGTNTVHAQQSAENLLSSVTSHDELVGRLEQMGKEMQAAKVAPELTRKAILERISGRDNSPPHAPAPGAAPANDGWSVKEVK